MTINDDARTKAVLAIERAMPPADRARILARFRNTNMDGADVADILDILADHDWGLEYREPFYESSAVNEAYQLLGWEPYSDDEPNTLEMKIRHSIVSHVTVAVALLTNAVPTAGAVSRMARSAAIFAQVETWTGKES